MEEVAHRFLVAAHQRRDLGDPFATSAGQHHLAATHLYAIRRAQTGSQGRALLVGERTDKDGRSHTSQDTPFRPTFTEIALAGSANSWSPAQPGRRPRSEFRCAPMTPWSLLLRSTKRTYLHAGGVTSLGPQQARLPCAATRPPPPPPPQRSNATHNNRMGPILRD